MSIMSLSLNTFLKNNTVSAGLDRVLSTLELLGLASIKSLRHRLRTIVYTEEAEVSESSNSTFIEVTEKRSAENMSVTELLTMPLMDRLGVEFKALRQEVADEISSFQKPVNSMDLTIADLAQQDNIEWDYLCGNQNYLVILTKDGGTVVQDRKSKKLYRSDRFLAESDVYTNAEIEFAKKRAAWLVGKGQYPGELSDHTAA